MVYKWYILPIGGLYTTYHPLQEPEKSIELLPVLIVINPSSRGYTPRLPPFFGEVPLAPSQYPPKV